MKGLNNCQVLSGPLGLLFIEFSSVSTTTTTTTTKENKSIPVTGRGGP
jgi:hypothetical protein